jgi:hypothetical protein
MGIIRAVNACACEPTKLQQKKTKRATHRRLEFSLGTPTIVRKTNKDIWFLKKKILVA